MFLTTLLTLIVFSGMVTPCIFLLVSFFLIKERDGVKGNLSKTIAQCPQKPHRMGPKFIQIAFRVENILGCNLFYTVHGCDCKIRRQLPNVRLIQNRWHNVLPISRFYSNLWCHNRGILERNAQEMGVRWGNRACSDFAKDDNSAEEVNSVPRASRCHGSRKCDYIESPSATSTQNERSATVQVKAFRLDCCIKG